MNFFFITVVVVLVLLSGVLVYRATSLFQDLQVEPAIGITEIQVDKTRSLQHFSNEWPHPPFEGVVVNGTIWGRVTPDTLRFVHGIDEQVAVEEYFQVIGFYYHLIRRSTMGME